MGLIFVIFLFLGGGIFFYLFLKNKLNLFGQQINEQFNQTVKLLVDTHKTVGDRLESVNQSFLQIQKSLGHIEETNRYLYEVSKNIVSLQELLRVPKFRGELGETLLENLLNEILPKQVIKIQHRFQTGDAVDACIVVGKNIIPIDAKFSLDNYRKYLEAETEMEKKSFYRKFLSDVKSRMDEISSKYILPNEGTFDFALMYIPSEAVYYEITKNVELNQYAKEKKVIVVSPNTFYAYLQAILYGLKGITLNQNLRKILSEIAHLQVEFRKFKEEFDVLGGHLNNASKKYTEVKSKLEVFSERLITTTQVKQIESTENQQS